MYAACPVMIQCDDHHFLTHYILLIFVSATPLYEFMLLEQLIEEVRGYPCLWKKNLDEYRNQNIRDNAWDNISKESKEPGR